MIYFLITALLLLHSIFMYANFPDVRLIKHCFLYFVYCILLQELLLPVVLICIIQVFDTFMGNVDNSLFALR